MQKLNWPGKWHGNRMEIRFECLICIILPSSKLSVRMCTIRRKWAICTLVVTTLDLLFESFSPSAHILEQRNATALQQTIVHATSNNALWTFPGADFQPYLTFCSGRIVAARTIALGYRLWSRAVYIWYWGIRQIRLGVQFVMLKCD